MAALPEGTPAPALRAGLYGRASHDPKKRGRSVADQMTDNRRTCAERGYLIVNEYVDLDRSASRHARRGREDYERLVADITAGQLDILVSWESSRVNRDLEAYVKLRNLCMESKVLWCYNGTVYDMRKGSDRTVTGFMAMMAEAEADGIQERNARTTRLAAGRGSPHGKTPFGYTRRYDPTDGSLIGQFPHDENADVVADLFVRAAALESLSSLARRLSDHVPKTTEAGVRYLLKNRAYIGLRSHYGQDVKALWDGIVDEGLFWRVQEVLADPARRTSRDGRAVHLLSGIADCGLCDESERARWLRRMKPTYGDLERYGCGPAGHVSVGMEKLNAYVEAGLMHWLASPAAAAAFVPVAPGELASARSRLAALRGQLQEARELASKFDPVTYIPKLSALSLADMESRVLPLMEQAEADVRRLASIGDPVVDRLLGADPELREGVWDDLEIEQQRHALRRLVRVTLFRAARMGDSRLDSKRVRLLFVGQAGFEPAGRRTRGLSAVSD
jgi:DNA invertase Pin-like site-specific DNA recombinase